MTNGDDIGQLGVSNVSLIKSVIEEKRDFLPDEKEFRARRETIVTQQAQDAQIGTTTVFTVPENSTLFITHASVSTINDAASNEQMSLSGGGDLFICSWQVQAGNVVNMSYSFTMPVRAEAGRVISFNHSQASIRTSVLIIGWLERKEVLTTIPVVAPPQ